MKELIVIRHAKSSWDDPSLDDFDRPLNARGKRDAPEMGSRLKRRGIVANRMVSSPAKRAYATCKKIAPELGCEKSKIEKHERLYHAEPKEILSVSRTFDDGDETVFIFGHNPGLTEFVNMMGKDLNIDNVPTCGVVALRFNVHSWQELKAGTGEFLFFDFPKRES